MTVTAWTVIAVLGAVLLFFLGWRWASRVWSLPCPTLLAWALAPPMAAHRQEQRSPRCRAKGLTNRD
jgi:hypothetical protein